MFNLKHIILFVAASTTFNNRVGAQQSDTLHLYFDLGIAAMNRQAQSKIDDWLYNDRITSRSSILIVGYADYIGGNESNDRLSEARAIAVQDYLVGMNISKEKIKLCVGKGEVERAVEKAGGYVADRRVDIVLLPGKTTVAKKTPAPPVQTIVPARSIATVKTGETLVLDNIYFYPGRHFVREESMHELDNLYQVLYTHPAMFIQIEGHVCCVKSPDALDEDTFEEALSVNRARFIYEYLIKKGIDAGRLKYRGFGRTRPLVAEEHTAEDENKNRRVEVRVLKQ